MTEIEYVTSAIVAKVFQGDENKRNAAEHIARVAIKAGAEWYEQNFTDGIDQVYVRDEPYQSVLGSALDLRESS